MQGSTQASSYTRTRNRFNKSTAAAKYAGRHHGNQRDRREQQCILRALQGLPTGSRVLDLPCGVGRLASVLVANGYLVTGADSSSPMIGLAQQGWRTHCRNSTELEGRAQFDVQDIMGTSYENQQFDAVICNRLFHHFIEPSVRRAALSELRRISAGPVIVSFFNSFSLESIRLGILRAVFHKFARDRIPISVSRFAADGQAAGLRLQKVIATRWGISPQCYAVFRAES
ncbi:MAG: class I SAM-dependent methyltransferase [Planctomycetes bacterium]|nr:class I SAM-dependent methyltransferase [Planctomycetota bacterium]